MSSKFETFTVIVPNNQNLAATLKDDPSNGNRNAYCLGRTNGLKLQLGGSDHNVITAMNFYPSRADESNGTNAATAVMSSDGTHAATISGVRVDGTTVPLVAIAWDSDRQWVQIANIERNSPMQPDCVWFTLTIAHNHNDHHWTFTLDPELVNTGGSGGGWSPTSPSDPVTLVRVAVD